MAIPFCVSFLLFPFACHCSYSHSHVVAPYPPLLFHARHYFSPIVISHPSLHVVAPIPTCMWPFPTPHCCSMPVITSHLLLFPTHCCMSLLLFPLACGHSLPPIVVPCPSLLLTHCYSPPIIVPYPLLFPYLLFFFTHHYSPIVVPCPILLFAHRCFLVVPRRLLFIAHCCSSPIITPPLLFPTHCYYLLCLKWAPLLLLFPFAHCCSPLVFPEIVISPPLCLL